MRIDDIIVKLREVTSGLLTGRSSVFLRMALDMAREAERHGVPAMDVAVDAHKILEQPLLERRSADIDILRLKAARVCRELEAKWDSAPQPTYELEDVIPIDD